VAPHATAVVSASLIIIVLCALISAATVVPTHASPATAAGSDGRLITWDRSKEGSVFLDNVRDEETIPGAPRTFRDKLQRQLRRIWRLELDGAAECKQVPGIQVWSLRTDGYALGNVVSQVGNTGCTAGASGAVVFWVKQRKVWKRAIGTADIVECKKLRRIKFPSELGVDRCFNGRKVVRYHQA
jgi:hypothetical protein